MATLATTNIKHAGSSSNNIVLNANGTATISGHIIQVAQDVLDTPASFTSLANDGTSFYDTGLSLGITPQAASSKVLVLATLYHASQAATNTARFNIVRGSTTIAQPASGSGGNDGTSINYLNVVSMITTPINFLDSPSYSLGDTLTYKIQIGFDAPGSNTAHYMNRYHGADQYRGISTLTLMEVAA
tara:strand:+ start:3374 stop:3934 length:561 start_codon:yes stop_codon:yes gene_type:complete